MPPVGRAKPVHKTADLLDRLVVSLRSYVTRPEKADKSKTRGQSGHEFQTGRLGPTDWVLIFDCETTTTPDQRLKFGTYQLRNKGRLAERGLFYEPDALTVDEIAVLHAAKEAEWPSEDGEQIYLLTRHEFVERVFFKRAYELGAQIVGFNLPFDISRLAVRHVDARRKMRGGFSFVLIDDENWPHVSVKHISQRMSWMRFTGTNPLKQHVENSDDDSSMEESPTWDRGYFVDLKTLAAALTSESHTLESLSDLLDVPNKKLNPNGHGKIIDLDYVRYALRDTQTSWECFDALAKKVKGLKLADTGLYDLFSEASLGKAYLKTMGIKPWQKMQPNFPAKTIGRIMSTYYGGRSEVHIRREITPIIHFDFLSMYPTVCTLMNLWRFVIATGIEGSDDTASINNFVSNCTAETLCTQSAWQNLNAIVRVLPQHDLFPVRSYYDEDEPATIGLNYLTSDDPLWFTLADVLASKILTGKTPQILEAVRFSPISQQQNLQPVSVAGKPIHPSQQDFYKELIIHRLAITKKLDTAEEAGKQALESDRLAIKILANATSYGIFMELNVEDTKSAKEMTVYGVRDKAAGIRSRKFEEPGPYFHPLLGTLITGGARLMLALAERQVIDRGLDWAFCDTDSIAIANSWYPDIEQFKEQTLAVQSWFSSLNPYGERKSILKLEKVDFQPGADGDTNQIDPPYCLTVSAKRYVLFNRNPNGESSIRKASGHGLGHLFPPYDEPPKDRRERIRKIGVPLWQADLWREIIRAADSDKADEVHYGALRNFNLPAASRYAATNITYLKWFDGYNGLKSNPKSYVEQVKPFNFLLSLQIKSRIEMEKTDKDALHDPLWHRREPHPAAPYSDGEEQTYENAFDRDRPEFTRIPTSWLKSYARSLVRYHMHPEAKFMGGNYHERGLLSRRHIHALAFLPIGKETDNLDEREFIGNSDEDIIERPLARQDNLKLRKFVLETQKQLKLSDLDLYKLKNISRHTIKAIKTGRHVDDSKLLILVRKIETLRHQFLAGIDQEATGMELLAEKRKQLGSDAALAEYLGKSRPYVTRLLNGKRPLTERLMNRLKK